MRLPVVAQPTATTDTAPSVIRQVIVKVHSRCNLSCDYCYVYEHADQSWRRQPVRMAPQTIQRLASRIGEHAERHGLPRISVVLHGGEPLLAGLEMIDRTVALIRAALPAGTTVDLSVQTNGILLSDSFLQVFHRHRIRVGVSMDGAQASHDKHRTYRNGRGSFRGVASALKILRRPEHRQLYGGLLCTIDVDNDPVETYEALLAFAPPRMDFLLPHGNWSTPPPHRVSDPSHTPYADWLIAVFERWYTATRRETEIRLFDSIIRLLVGGHSTSEAIGLDEPDLVTVETDGSYELSDALKTTVEGMAATGLDVWRHSLDDVVTLSAVAARRGGIAALAPACRSCPIVSTCGGGLHAHRFAAENGFDNPSVYCPDLFRVIRHIETRVTADLVALAAR